MPQYTAPISDMAFLLHDVFKVSEHFAQIPRYSEVNNELIDAILEEAGKFCATKLAPLNRQGDEIGARFENGQVITAPGFKEAYQDFIAGGWQGLSLPESYGGQNLPKTLQVLFDEMLSSANMSFGLFPCLTRGASEAIIAHGSEALKAQWLPKMISGEWAGVMDLTEPQAGTDLGLIRTEARPQPDGTYKITGTKIFITGGEQDLTDNIIHLVLARLPDAEAGVKGISLFLVPKMLTDSQERSTIPNNVTCGSIEHKMGIKASPTCVINFDGATGFLIGQKGKGLNAMFTMMNTERIMVGVQGIGIAETAYQNASLYAKERMQGRDIQSQKPSNILAHPDVRRNLLTARVWTEGMRALALFTTLELDLSETHENEARRHQAEGLVALLTPIIKAAGSDLGLEATICAQQVLGGHGYIREWGMEQYVRDARITQIYEGTNGVQALDLVARKLHQNEGHLPQLFFDQVEATLKMSKNITHLADLSMAQNQMLDHLKKATLHLQHHHATDPALAGASSTDYLRLFALTAMGWMWLNMLLALENRPKNDPLCVAKRALAEFFFARLAPQSIGLYHALSAPSSKTMQLSEDLF